MPAEESPASARGRVLVVDDDDSIRDVVSTALDVAGFDVVAAASGQEALGVTLTDDVDLIVLDVMMPGMDGREVCRTLRARDDTTPIVFLTARDSPADTLEGFALGGDDYLSKPFHLPELIARIDAVLRRSRGAHPAGDTISVEGIVLDDRAHRVQRDGRPVDLSPTEFRLLRYLMVNAGAVLSKAQIAKHLWEFDLESDGNIVETHISYLRKKLGPPSVVQTVRGVGYVLRPADR